MIGLGSVVNADNEGDAMWGPPGDGLAEHSMLDAGGWQKVTEMFWVDES